LAVLSETGYDGYVSGEFMPAPDANIGARRAIEHLRSVM
jgi:sugar phosphate isomerase/epimerase